MRMRLKVKSNNSFASRISCHFWCSGGKSKAKSAALELLLWLFFFLSSFRDWDCQQVGSGQVGIVHRSWGMASRPNREAAQYRLIRVAMEMTDDWAK